MNRLTHRLCSSTHWRIRLRHSLVFQTLPYSSSSPPFSSIAASASPPSNNVNSSDGPSPYISGNSTHFGFEEVRVQDKEPKVTQVFNKVADTYDVMNDFMSLGIHRLWKDYLLETSNVAAMAHLTQQRQHATSSSDKKPQIGMDEAQNNASATDSLQPRLRILDVAGGTGDVAFRFVEAAGCWERSKSTGLDPCSITVCDLNHEMLRVGEARARARFGNALLDQTRGLRFVQGNAQALDMDDNTFDLYTIAFGLRNVTDVDQALREAYRVLKPGGRFLCLEFSHVTVPGLAHLYDAYSFNVIPALGEYVAHDRASYQYLVESIRQFSNQQELASRLRAAGFVNVKFTNLAGGIVALHEGWKPVD